MKLGRLYRLNEFEPEWAKFFAYPRRMEFYLPTEVVVCSPQMVAPTVARAYETELYAFKGHVVTYEWLIRLASILGKKFEGTCHYDGVRMVEVWENNGSDGHVEYRLSGFRFVPESVLELKCDSWRSRGANVPEAMREQWFD